MAESFNSWIAMARNKLVVDLIDTVRSMLMDQRAKRKVMSDAWQGPLVPFVEDYIREITTRKEQFIVRLGNMSEVEVEGSQGRNVVNVETHQCSCKVWQVSGLPCIHAVAFLCSKGHTVWHNYVSEHYYAARYRLAYEGTIAPMPGKEKWTLLHDTVLVDVPNTSRPRGRPRKKRFKIFLEESSTSKKNKHRCSRCMSWGNHRNSCKNPIASASHLTQSASTSRPTKCRSKLSMRRGLQSTVVPDGQQSDYHEGETFHGSFGNYNFSEDA